MDEILGDSSAVSHNIASDIEPILSTTGYSHFKKLNTVLAYRYADNNFIRTNKFKSKHSALF